jgi:hypothetical protein
MARSAHADQSHHPDHTTGMERAIMTVNEAIAQNLTAAGALLERMTADLAPQDYLHRPCAEANCAAWIVGHLILTERSALKRLGVTDLPPLPEGFETRIPREATAAARASDFGDVTQLVPIFKQHRAMLVEAVKRATPEQLGKPLDKPHPLFSTIGGSVNFMGVHVAMHSGQISTIRRTLGRPPLI